MAKLTGIAAQAGHFNNNVTATPQTTNVYGISVNPYASQGTITNFYDLYLDTSYGTESNITNHYGVYQRNSSAKNYFAGNVGIGTNDPGTLLHLHRSRPHIQFTSPTTGTTNPDGTWLGFTLDDSTFYVRQKEASPLELWTNDLPRLHIDPTGNVGIGTTTPTEKLHVVGNIIASGTITPDYVFEKYYEGESALKSDYEMMSLAEIERFTRANKHLPGVPSAKEVSATGGILVNRATEINLEKIEELYLHLIEQQKQIEDLKAQVERLTTNKEQ